MDEKDAKAIWEAALTLEKLGEKKTVTPVLTFLKNPDPRRRQAAVRALGWMGVRDRRIVSALIRVLEDVSQSPAVRGEAAESLSLQCSARAIPPLIEALSDPNVEVRFWSVFALGVIRDPRTGENKDRRVVPALEQMLNDPAMMPGYWSVGREALAMLGSLRPPRPPHDDILQREIETVLRNRDTSPEDRWWADFYEPKKV